VKKFMSFVGVIELCVVVAMIQAGHTRNQAPRSTTVIQSTSAPFRDGLYLGKLAAQRGPKPDVPTGRWSSDGDRTLFAEGFNRGYQDAVESAARTELSKK